MVFRRYTMGHILVTKNVFIKQRRESTPCAPHRHPVRLVHAPSWLPEESNELGVLVPGAAMDPLGWGGVARLTPCLSPCVSPLFDCTATPILGFAG